MTVHPNVNVDWFGWNCLLFYALFDVMSRPHRFSNACFLINIVPAEMLTATSDTGETPLQFIRRQMARVDACDARGREIMVRWTRLEQLVAEAAAAAAAAAP